jgi:tripartite-type tricarboxylate transporter receptor subunit TctC
MKALPGILGAILFYTAVSIDRPAHAQSFPSKPVRLIVPTGAGGGLDLVARHLAAKLSEHWGKGVVVENRVGAGGTIGVDAVAKSAADGYTLAVVATSFVINAAAYSKLPYDSIRDFAPVTTVTLSPLIMVANPAFPVRTVNELVALAKSKPGEINFSSTGNGGGVHLSIEMLLGLTGVKAAHIPYKGTVAAVTDVVEGRVQFTVTGIPVALPFISSGKLRALAVAGSKRSAAMPDVPAMTESIPDYGYNNWIGVLAPARTPPDILAQLHSDIVQVMQTDDMRQKLKVQGDETSTMSSAQFANLIQQEIARYTALVKAVGVKLD